jgi:hypothetical protein
MKALRAIQPMVVLIGLAAVLIAVTTVARLISARAGFLVERDVVFRVWIVGLLIISAVFARVARRSLGEHSRSTLWLMAITGLVLASPLALMLLQHPTR